MELCVVGSLLAFIASFMYFYFVLPKLNVSSELPKRAATLSLLTVSCWCFGTLLFKTVPAFVPLIIIGSPIVIIRLFINLNVLKAAFVSLGLYVANIITLVALILLFVPSYQPT